MGSNRKPLRPNVARRRNSAIGMIARVKSAGPQAEESLPWQIQVLCF